MRNVALNKTTSPTAAATHSQAELSVRRSSSLISVARTSSEVSTVERSGSAMASSSRSCDRLRRDCARPSGQALTVSREPVLGLPWFDDQHS